MTQAFFVLSLVAFILGQAVFLHHDGTEFLAENIVPWSQNSQNSHRLILESSLWCMCARGLLRALLPFGKPSRESEARCVCRFWTFFISLGHLLYRHVRNIYVDVSTRNLDRSVIPIPKCLCEWHELGSLLLTSILLVMLALEPILWCINNEEPELLLFTTKCHEAEDLLDAYSYFASAAILLYWFLSIDLCVLSMRLHALILVCSQLIPELVLFLLTCGFLIGAFATALNAVDHSIEDLDGVPNCVRTLGSIILNLVPKNAFKRSLPFKLLRHPVAEVRKLHCGPSHAVPAACHPKRRGK